MSATKRSGNRWTINEVLSLQREYELLEWSVQEIAVKHQRSVMAIVYRLDQEGFIDSWNNIRGFDFKEFQNSGTNNTLHLEGITYDISDDSEDENFEAYDSEDENFEDDDSEYFEKNDKKNDELNKLADRVWNLETVVTDISSMVKQIFDDMVASKSSPKMLVQDSISKRINL